MPAISTEHHTYQIELLANPLDVSGVIEAIQGVLGENRYPTEMAERNDSWYYLSEKPLGELQAQLEQIPGVKHIEEINLDRES